MKKTILSAIVIFVLSFNVFAQTSEPADALTGTWLVQDKTAKIKIEKTNKKFDGKIVWLNPPLEKDGTPHLDTKNPDKSLRTQPIMGLLLLKDFIYDGHDHWSGGTIYDSNSGKTYKCKIKFVDKNTIEVRGFVGISLFGRTETWARSEDATSASVK